MNKREFLTASVGLGLGGARAFAQQTSAAVRTPRAEPAADRKIPNRMVKTTKLFKSPPGFPNAIAVAPEGLWIAEQKLSGAQAVAYHLPEPKDLTEQAWLVDWDGKLLKTVKTPSRNTSGMAYGAGCVWMVANAPPEGVFQVDMNSRLVSHRQIPLGPAGWAEYLRMDGLPPDFLEHADHAAFHLLAARIDGEMVAAALAYDFGDDCGIYNVGTVEKVRRRGLGTALTAAQAYDARARGCRTASLQSTPMAERVYAAVGFRDLGRILEYVPSKGDLR